MGSVTNYKINWFAVFVVIIYPIIITSLALCYSNKYGIGALEISLMIASYYTSNIAVGVGFHRLWTHESFKTSKGVEFILALLTAWTLQGPVLAWASDHRRHHAFTDQEGDPHSPFKYKSKILGFLWSHLGWMLLGEGSYKNLDKVTMLRLGRNPILVWQLKYYWKIAVFMNVFLPLILGYCFSGTLQGAIAWYIFTGVGRFIQQEMTFCVNSLCHLIGYQSYSSSTARDIPWLSVLLLGENWHNFHHAFAQDYRNGHKWYHFDVHKWIIVGMEKLGIAKDLVVTPNERIIAKKLEIIESQKTNLILKLSMMEKLLLKLSIEAKRRLLMYEESANILTIKVKGKLKIIESSAYALRIKIKELIHNHDNLKEKIVAKVIKKISNLQKMYEELEMAIIK